jgi:hypothetical protein
MYVQMRLRGWGEVSWLGMSSIGVGQSVHCPRLGPGPTTNLLTQFHAMRCDETQQCVPEGHFRFASSRGADGMPVATSCTMHLSAPLWAQQPRDDVAWLPAGLQLVPADAYQSSRSAHVLLARAVSLDCTRLGQLSGALMAASPMDHGPWTMALLASTRRYGSSEKADQNQNHAGGARILLGLGMHPQLGRRGLFIFTAAGAVHAWRARADP